MYKLILIELSIGRSFCNRLLNTPSRAQRYWAWGTRGSIQAISQPMWEPDSRRPNISWRRLWYHLIIESWV
jgi:hypothetical protein